MKLCCHLRRLLLCCCGLIVACLVLPAQALTLELREAQAAVTVQGQTTRETVSLPYHWDRHHAGLAGEATFEVPFELAEAPTVPFGLYLPRLGNAYEIWLNGALLQQNGDLQHDNGPDFAKAPRHIEISPGLLRTHNLFRVHIRADVGRRGGLAPLTLGPDKEVYPLYLHDYRWRSTGSFIVVIVSLLIGVGAMALWATQVDVTAPGWPRRDPLYLYAGVAELCWTVSVSDAIVEHPPISWPWWGMVALMAVTVWVGSMILFCAEVASWSQLRAVSWLRRWLALLLVASVAAGTTSLVYGYPLAMTLLYAVLGLTSLIFVSLFIWKAARGASLPHQMVALVLLWNTLVGLRDLYVFRISQAYGGNTLLRYSSVLFGLTLGFIVITRFRAASAQARDLNANLAARVAQKEQELEQTYQRVEQLAREQERTAERTRILRDMHDGVGAHISTAIRQLESGRASHAEVLQTLRDSLDQLKLSIDAMNLPPGDITALLANLRYRLEPRFKASDIELQWDVDLLAPLARLDDKTMRQLQFMVFEALSNVLQHAHANQLRIELRATLQGGAQLRVIDNGCGFETERVKRRGLSSLRERAAAIGADLLISSVPGYTVVEIVLN
ncbi:sensor histidine kinase [Rhodoferax sp. UBA5149]|uniref:sensor histidine kinase n=1 Tax=Rhodoferax sp. UBA5149 TaxID=1947379 RepID=UPI0025CF2BE2|nr:ATP-binding protein [Rhodoferax sp. UBA5149]